MGQPDNFEIHGSIPEIAENNAEEYFRRVNAWSVELNLAYTYLSSDDFYQLGQEAIKDIDSSCPYYQEIVCIRGIALMPAPNSVSQPEDSDEERPVSQLTVIDRNEEDGTVYAAVDSMFGIHNGVRLDHVKNKEGELDWRIRQMVIIGSSPYSYGQGTRFGNETLAAYFEMDSEIMLVEEVDSAVNGQDQATDMSADIVAAIDYYSSNLVQLLNSKKFRGLPHKRQLHLFEQLIQDAESHAPVRDREVAVSFMYTAKTPRNHNWKGYYVYVPEIYGANVRYRRQYIIGDIIGGLCMGLTSIEESTLKEKPIRKPADLKAPKAGLCLALVPDDVTSERTGTENLIYVPVSSQDFDAVFE